MPYIIASSSGKCNRTLAHFCSALCSLFTWETQTSFTRLYNASRRFASIDKDTRGSAGRKCPHTASKPLRMHKVFSAAFCLRAFLLRQNCFASDSLGFSRDFCSFGRMRAVARQGEKGKKHRKDWLSDVCALVNRRFPLRIQNIPSPMEAGCCFFIRVWRSRDRRRGNIPW